MKIVSWNCNGALRQKFNALDVYDADIYVIQECENPIETKDDAYQEWAGEHLWTGNSKNKGIGIFAKNSHQLEHLRWPTKFRGRDVKHFLPCRINDHLNLLGVWTHKNNSPTFGYIGQLWKYMELNKEAFQDIVLAGDFNSNSKWDHWDRWWNHSDVVQNLKELDIISCYHSYFEEEHGAESRPTFFLQRNLEKPFHLDYIFAPDSFPLNKVSIGAEDDWLPLSDHLPICGDFQTLL